VNPLVSWIWIGGIVMSLGALFSLLPRLLPHVAAATTEQTQEDKTRMPRGVAIAAK
jgi:cytochrome c biogenesis factor